MCVHSCVDTESQGTRLLADAFPGTQGSNADCKMNLCPSSPMDVTSRFTDLMAANGVAYFRALVPLKNYELGVVSRNGTLTVHDLNTYPGATNPQDILALGDGNALVEAYTSTTG